MRDEDFEKAPSTPVKSPLKSENEEDVPTPTRMSPIKFRFSTSIDQPTDTVANNTTSMEETVDDSVRLSEGEGAEEAFTNSKEGPNDSEGGIQTSASTNDSGQLVDSGDFGELETDISRPTEAGLGQETPQQSNKDDNGFGDGFDDFGETVEAGDEFDDFEGFEEGKAADDFDDFTGFEEGTTITSFGSIPEPTPAPVPPTPAVSLLPVPVIDFDSFNSSEEANATVTNIVSKLYPSDSISPHKRPPQRPRTGMFLTERSESLWNQLVAPPPLQPPDWKRSRIRRLFLVSLGVPVDLDEILPASKQKKLILPSSRPVPAHITSDSSPSSRRNSTDSASGSSRRPARSRSRPGTAAERTSSSHRASKGDKFPPMPDFDEASARILCSTSDLVLSNFDEKELRAHIRTLQKLTNTASELLTYWLKKRDGAMSDKETFETVIESLVGYARKTRQGAR
ncbi:hypothetical protein BDZ91DRAFT_713936 [Kalaharituber pfeilii]|nr:hypothetical protein BDZ91DRAFT_713936 [Kalaharituber pfeilii]